MTLAGGRTQSHGHPAVNVTITTQQKEVLMTIPT